MPAKFLIWSTDHKKGQCIARGPQGIKKAYQLNQGISRAVDWPKDVVLRMDPEYPKEIALTDNLYGSGYAVISKRLKDVLIAERVEQIEFLPVQILDLKKRVASQDYSILNALAVVDCVDTKASKVQWNDIDPELLDSCKKLVLMEKSVPAQIKVFRPKHAEYLILVRAELVERLSRENFVGIGFRDPADFDGA